MLSQRARELLLSGYTRLNYNGNIPDDIILLFIEWINNALYVIIDGDLMKEFLLKKHGEAMKDKYIIQLSEELSLKCTIYPNGYDMGGYGQVSWNLEPIITNPNICRMRFYLESGCDEIPNAIYKETGTIFNRHRNLSQSMISFLKCQNKEKLTFYVNPELICYDIPSEITKYFIESPIYDSHIEYEWIIENKALQQFKNCPNGQWAFSPNFANNNIGIFCTPNGDTSDEAELTLGVEFYKIPNKIKYLSANIQFKTNIKGENGDYMEYAATENYIKHGFAFNVDYDRFTTKMFENISKKLVFNVIIDITKVRIGEFAEEEMNINKCDWSKYGIIDNT